MNKLVLSASALAVAFALGLVGPVAVLAASPASVNLGSAGNYAILAKTGISTTGTTAVVGDLGLSPAAATYITGFSLILPAAGAFSTSAIVTGKIYAPGYADPTPANLSTAVSDMETAYTDAAGRAADVTELGAGNIGGLTLAPGVYKWGTGLTIPTDVTLAGGQNDVWIFQIAQNLNIASAAKIILAGGAKANNIFWVVAGQTTIGTTAVFNGNILDQTAIVLNTGATLIGRALAQSAVTLDANAVTSPAGGSAAVPAPATPAVPATPATGTGVPATPATPAISATPAVPANQSQIDALMVTLRSLQAQVVARQNASTLVSGQQIKTIAANLNLGSNSSAVTILQQFLIAQGSGSAAQALARNGATKYFGSLTRSALAEWQAKVGISPALGNFGPVTRSYIKANY
jgi:hypothetical protein